MKNIPPKFYFKQLIFDKIKKAGGWTNAHAHCDRAFTINPNSLNFYINYSLEKKWDLVDKVKKDASVTQYYDRICAAIEVMLSQGVTALGSFIDIDPICKDRAIRGALKAREKYKKDIQIKFINQVLKGVIEKEARKWFEIAVDYVDIIGGLPKRDERAYGKGEEHIEFILKTAKRTGKMVHVHVDQFNTANDKETELLADKTIEYHMEGMVVAIHCISLAAHPKSYREKIYTKMKKADLMVVACPMAWIDHPRKETLQPFHNSLTPIDELVPHGITVALGTDNICDFMLPFCNGDMWQELSLLSAGNRFMDLEQLVKIASINGRKVLGIK